MALDIGEIYEVPCAELRWRNDGRVYYVPVFDHFHADAQFGFPDQHYHIHARFDMEPRMRHFFKIHHRQTNSVIIHSSKNYELKQIARRSVLCVGHLTGLRVPEDSELYRQWYQGYVGKKCAGRKCPHFGTEMLEQDGQLVCPMHGLMAELPTLKIIAQS